MSTFSPVWASSSVWNRSMGCAWFSASHRAFRLRCVSANGRLCSLGVAARSALGEPGPAPLDGGGTHRLPATSSTCSSAVWASSGGRTARRLSLKERTLSATQPPISGGSTSRWFRSTLRLVSLVSFPKEWGRAWPGGVRIRDQQEPEGAVSALALAQTKQMSGSHYSARLQVFPILPASPTNSETGPTVSRFSVRISSDRFSQSPMASVTSHRRFWSTFKMDNCFS